MNTNPNHGSNSKENQMSTLMRTASVAVLFTLGLAPTTRAAEQPKSGDTRSGALPFTVKVTKEELKESPPGMGGSGQDYPYCAVRIEDECWILDGHSGGGPSRAKGSTFLNVVKQPMGRNENNKHVDRPYMLGGMWYDAAEKKLYAPMHCETHIPECAGHSVNAMDRQIHLSSSTDKGATWKYEGPIVTKDDPAAPWRSPLDFSYGYWDGGDGDFYLFADTRGGYVYLYSNHYTWGGEHRCYLRHRVARCAIADKMAPGKWKRFYNGKWEEPGLGGKASYVNAYYVMYNTYLKKYLSFNYGSGISFCSDMDKQDWSPSYVIQPVEAWGTTWDKGFHGFWFGWGGWHVMNEDRTDIHTGGQTLYWYKYWMGYKTECYRLDLDTAPAKENHGYHPLGGYAFTPTVYSGPQILYGEAPFYDSADPIESRRTLRLERDSAAVTASPGWGKDGVSSTAGSSLEFSFKAADVYWRTARGPGMGQADVYLDGKLDVTVDTWASVPMNMFAYVKTGLDPNVQHTLKVVVRGEKNPKSTGAVIAHRNFEYSADTTRALYSFSAIQGKHQWRYQERLADKLIDMKFSKEKREWVGDGGARIGPGRLATGRSEPVLRWTAHRTGTVRIEGNFWGGGSGRLGDLHVTILHNGESVWPKAEVLRTREGSFNHDLKVAVKQGDTISFEARIPAGPLDAKGAPPANEVRNWDPILTYVEP
jgi:hypothetical protein